MAILHDSNLPAGNSGFAPPDNAGKKEEENPFMKKVQQAGEAKLAAIVMGDSMRSKGEGDGETLAVQIVKSAMDNSTQLVKQANDMAQYKDKEAQESRQIANKSQLDLYGMMLSEITHSRSDLAGLIDKLNSKTEAPPRDAVSIMKEAKELLTLMGGDVFGVRSAPPPHQGNSAVEVQLETLKQAHALALKQLDFTMAEADRKFQLQMLQFQEDTKWKREEHEENKGKGKETIDSLMDIGQSILAATTAGSGVGVQAAPHQVAAEAAEGPAITLTATKYPCQFCHAILDISEAGDKATCPGCGAEFKIS